MDKSTQTDETTDFVAEIADVLESFLRKLTSEPLESQEPDNVNEGTKAMVAEIISDMLLSLKQSAVRVLRRRGVALSEERVLSALVQTLPRTFADAVLEEDRISSRCLMDLISAEITESVNFTAEQEVVSARHTCPGRLNDMVHHTCKMIKKQFRPRRQRRFDVTNTQTGSDATVSDVIQEILRKEVSGLAEHLLSEVSDNVYTLLESGLFLDTKNIAGDIAEVIESAMTLDESRTRANVDPSVVLINVRNKITSFIANQFARISIYRIAAQLKAKYFNHRKIEDEKPLQTLMASVEFMLRTSSHGNEQDGVCLSSWLKDVCSCEGQIFTNPLIDALNKYSDELRMCLDPLEPSHMTVFVTKAPDVIDATIKDKVWLFFEQIMWWMKTQADPLSDSLTDIIMKETTESALMSRQSHAKFQEQIKERQDRNKCSVRTVVEMLISHIMKKIKMKRPVKNIEDTTNWLFQRIWSEVQSEDFTINPEHYKPLVVAIFKDLTNKWPGPFSMLIDIYLESPDIQQVIVTSFKYHLFFGPKDQANILKRLFSNMCKVISKPSRK